MGWRICEDIDEWLDLVWGYCSNEPESESYDGYVNLRMEKEQVKGGISWVVVEATLVAMAEVLTYRHCYGVSLTDHTGRRLSSVEAGRADARLCRAQLRRFKIDAKDGRWCPPGEAGNRSV